MIEEYRDDYKFVYYRANPEAVSALNNLMASYDTRLIFASKIKDYGYSPKDIDLWFQESGINQFPSDYTTDLREQFIDQEWGILTRSEDQLIMEEIFSYLDADQTEDYIIISGRTLPGVYNTQFNGSLAEPDAEERLNDLLCS